MQKKRKTIRILYWSFVAAGSLLLSILTAARGWGNIPIGLWLIAVFIGALAVDWLWLRSLGKQVNALLPLLHEDPDRYMEGIEALLGGAKALGLQQTRVINLAAARCEKGEYEKAAELLTTLDPRRIPPLNQGVYWADLALARFHLKQDQAACDIIDQQRTLFASAKDTPRLGGLTAVLSIYYARAKGNPKLAWERFYLARETWPDPSTQKELEELETLLRK